MHCQILPLERKRAELLAKLQAHKAAKQHEQVNKLSVLLCQCDQKLMEARVLDDFKRVSKG